MIRPSSRSSSCRRGSKRGGGRGGGAARGGGGGGGPGRGQSRGVGPARRKWTMRRPSSVITGIRRAVSGSKEVAKCVAIRSRGHVAWSIEAAFPAVGTELVRHCHFTGEAPQHSSDPLLEVADSGRVMGENQRKRAETRGTGAIAPHLAPPHPLTPATKFLILPKWDRIPILSFHSRKRQDRNPVPRHLDGAPHVTLFDAGV